MLGRMVRAVGRRLLPRSSPGPMTRLIRADARSDTFFRAIEFVNFERVAGDIVECGVHGGLSLAVLAKGATFDSKGMDRRIVGFDTFAGLPASDEVHPRWKAGDCAHLVAWHPTAAPGERVTPDTTRRLFETCGLRRPLLHEGPFAVVMPQVIPADVAAISLLHVDCDLYESTRDVLAAAAPALQDGTVVLFDDWFHYAGHPRKGEARAFREFLETHAEWDAVHWRSYATFCNAYILSRR